MPSEWGGTLCLIDGEPADVDALLPAAIGNFGHLTIMQVRGGKVRGLGHHIARLNAANSELFGRSIDASKLVRFLRKAVTARPDATLRVNVFGGGRRERLMLTLTPPVEHDPSPGRFSLIGFQRDRAHLKHVGSFGLLLRQGEAVDDGFDGAVFFDTSGHVSEATIWNVGFYDGASVVWPEADLLVGVTKRILDDGLRMMGVPVSSARIPVSGLRDYPNCFVTNSSTFGRAVAAVGSQDFTLDPALDAMLLEAYALTPMERPRL